MATPISSSDLTQLVGSVGATAVAAATETITATSEYGNATTTTNSADGGISLEQALINQIHVNAQTGEVTTPAITYEYDNEEATLTQAEKDQAEINRYAARIREANEEEFQALFKEAYGDKYDEYVQRLAYQRAYDLWTEEQKQADFDKKASDTLDQSKDLYNSNFTDRQDAVTKGKTLLDGLTASDMSYKYDFDKLAKSSSLKYGRSYADFDNLIDSFNVSQLPDVDNVAAPFVGHIIMTRPSLFVDTTGSGYGGYGSGNVAADPSATTNYSALRANAKTSAFVNDYYGKKLLNMLSYNSSSYYMPLFTTRAVSYPVGDVTLRTVEKGGTFCGHLIKYGIYSEEHKIGNSVSIEFQNDYYWSVLKTIYIWMMYIDIVTRSDAVRPSWTAQKSALLDYCGSIYYLVTDMGGSKLIYWEKLTGVFPKSAPLSMFSMENGPVVQDKISVEFDYGMKSDPMDPDVLFDINMLSGGNYTNAVRYLQYGPGPGSAQAAYQLPDYSKTPSLGGWEKETRADGFARGGATFGLGDQFALKPIIQCVKTSNSGAYSFYLHWLKPTTN